ncbi:MAG: hypothetical protein H8F28_17215 [Fibrella sp.]|nr:hypothetical protein [Armatimonadota bacterium]
METMETHSGESVLNDASFEETVRRGLAIYDEQLKPVLEPVHNGKAVAINVETGEYVIADDLPDARRLLREKYPTPHGVSLIIGPETDPAMLSRVMVGRKPMRRNPS